MVCEMQLVIKHKAINWEHYGRLTGSVRETDSNLVNRFEDYRSLCGRTYYNFKLKTKIIALSKWFESVFLT